MLVGPANALSGLRLLSAPVFAFALAEGRTGLAFLLFWFAVVTDLLDGRVARARGEASALGGLLDHLADATFVTLGLLAAATRGAAPHVLPVLVALAFAQYAADSRALRGELLRASALGRLNGIAYFVPLGTVAVRDALGLAFPSDAWIRLLGWLLVGSTLLSMLDRAHALLRTRTGGAS